jgi:hypothetical protein
MGEASRRERSGAAVVPDISNKFLSVEIIIPFLVLAVGGLVGYGSLSADVDHKAEKADVRVLDEKVSNIEGDVDEIKEEQKEQRTILERIDRAVARDRDE